jgi:hypothetical protein
MEYFKERDRKSTFTGTGSHLTVNDEKLKDPTNVASAFSNFFITITEKLHIQQLEKGDAISVLRDPFPGNCPSIKKIPITEAQLKSIIHSLKPKKSSGYDEITSKILKDCASLISHPFSYIHNHWLYLAVFCDCFKISVVKPPYKTGDKTGMTTYRPISLLTVFSTVFEKAMHRRLSYHLRANNILVTEWYGLRKVVSTEDAACSVFKCVNHKMHVG